MYTIGEAARLANVAPVTVRRWLFGYAPDPRFPHWRTPPVFGDKDQASPFVSFLQLVEIVVAADFRKVSRVTLERVRQVHGNARDEFAIEYPFAHDDLGLETLGGHVVRWLHGNGSDNPRAQAVDSLSQFSLPGLVAARLEQFDYEQRLAARWYPAGKGIPIVVDPLFSAGLPTIAGRGVTVGAIYRRWKASPDENIDFIADDLQLDAQLVERVLKYADKIAA
jgi:uncharacterized protein (DUF433 family)